MDLDIRLPIGLLFLSLGLILLACGIFSAPSALGQSLGVNINRDWGAVMTAFGALMTALAILHARRKP